MTNTGDWWLEGAVARLRPGATPEQAQAEANIVFRSFMADSKYPKDMEQEHFRQLNATSAAHGLDGLRRKFSEPLFVLMGIVGLVLLMAIANIANLLLARGVGRQREFAIRLAAGAGRLRLVRQIVTETLVLFLLGAVPGVFLAQWGVHAIESMFTQGRRPISLATELNWRVLVFSILLTILAGLFAALLPVWRVFPADLERSIRDGQTRTGGSRGSATLTRGLVVFQVALSLVLLAGALTFLRSLANLRNIDPGFSNEEALTMSLNVLDGSMKPRMGSRILDEVRAIPGVRAAAISTYTPLSGRDRGALVRIAGYTPNGFDESLVHLNQVSEGYFEALGIPLLRGRFFTDQDAEGAPKVALINESASSKFFGDREAIGQVVEFDRPGTAHPSYRIVGVVKDTKHMNLREAAPRFLFLPTRQPKDSEGRVTLIVTATAADGHAALLQPIRTRLAASEPGVLITDVITIRTQMDTTLLSERLVSGLSATFGVLALVLAAVGLYGVLSYRIGQQRRSFGIRMALGASPSSIAASVLQQSGVIVAGGLLIGLPFAFGAARMAESLLWGVTSRDPMIYVVGVAVLLVLAFVSAFVPARRAASIDPAEALRSE
jgi:predicted permease